MKKFKELHYTTNSKVYNILYKQHLANKGKIKCTFCKFHKSENNTENLYGGWLNNKLKFPSWKLVSKNKKQYEFKKLKYNITTNKHIKKRYVKIKW